MARFKQQFFRAGLAWFITVTFAPSAAVARQHVVDVTALDAATRAPIAHVHVHLESDTTSYDGFTDRTGVARFEDVPPGRYVVSLEQAAYSFGAPSSYTLGADGSSLTVDGVRTKLRQIGSAVSSAAANGESGVHRADDTASQLTGSVLADPHALPGLGEAPDGTLRLGAQGAATTTATVDGAPIVPGGFSVPASLFTSDLFSGAATGAATAGAPGGTLQLTSFDPTLDWQGLAEYRPASFGGESWGIRERGTTGRVGLAFSHAESIEATPLNGDTFADTSGLTYAHDTATVVQGSLLKLRLPSAAGITTFSAGELSVKEPLSCTLLEGTLPCGFGPGNRTTTSLAFAQFANTQTWSKGSLTSRAFASSLALADDEGRALVFGMPIGSDATSQTLRVGAAASAALLAGANRSLKLDLFAAEDQSHVSSAAATAANPTLQAGAPFVTPPSKNLTLSTRFSAPVVASARVSVAASGAFERSGGLGKFVPGIDASYRLGNSQSLTLSGALGSIGSPVFASAAVSPPNDLRLDCAGRALGSGPGQAVQAPSEDSVVAGYRLDRGPFHAGIRAQERVVHRSPVTGIEPATDVPQSLLGSDYYSLAAATAGSICGTPQPIAPASLFFTSNGTARELLEDGVESSVSVDIASRARLTGSYVIDRARFFGVPPDLTSFGYVANGAQAPTIPLQHGETTLAYRSSPASSLLARVTAFSSNNGYARYPFASLDAGGAFKLAFGDAVFGIQNITNAAAPRFTTFAPFPFASVDYPARSVSIRLRFAIGNSYVDRNAVLNPPVVPSDPGVLSFVPRDFERAPLAQLLSIDSSSPFCGPESRDAAETVLREIGLVAAQAVRGGATQTKSVTPDGIAFSVIRMPTGYVLRIAFPHDGRRIAPLLHCGRLHTGDVATANSLGLFTPDATTRFEDGPWVLYFSPVAGLYFAPEAIDGTLAQTASSTSEFPSRVPVERVRIDDRSCPRSERAAVEDILTVLRGAIPEIEKAKRTSWVSDDIRIVSHEAKRGTWLEIAFADSNLADAFARCYDVPSASDGQLRALSLGGTNTFPSLLYADAVGFYRFGP